MRWLLLPPARVSGRRHLWEDTCRQNGRLQPHFLPRLAQESRRDLVPGGAGRGRCGAGARLEAGRRKDCRARCMPGPVSGRSGALHSRALPARAAQVTAAAAAGRGFIPLPPAKRPPQRTVVAGAVHWGGLQSCCPAPVCAPLPGRGRAGTRETGGDAQRGSGSCQPGGPPGHVQRGGCCPVAGSSELWYPTKSGWAASSPGLFVVLLGVGTVKL